MQDIVRIAGRSEFQAAVRAAFAEAGAAGWHQITLCDADFAMWPLNEPVVIDCLTAWVNARRHLNLLALDYDEVLRRHPRFVRWRVQWAHAVQARALVEVQPADVPTLLHAPGALALRLLDPLRQQGRVSRLASDIASDGELIDAISQRSIEAFPPTTIGL